tara:strand:- start:306 stop:1016 length:711 start_codon:yes stop_codon:yes gene_type:complete
MNENPPDISVFFPLFNEEGNVRHITLSAIAALTQITGKFEVLLINDGSNDRTREIGEELSSCDSRVRVISHDTNLGYGAALKTGFEESKFDLIAFTDGDGQFDLSEIRLLLNKLPHHDAVIGFRVRRADPAVRTLNAKAWGFLIGVLFGIWPRDLDCGFKLFKRELIKQMELEANGAFISTELLAKSRRLNARIAEVGVTHYPRAAGESTGNNLIVIIKAFGELARFWIYLKRWRP